jgi:hypothetical protein
MRKAPAKNLWKVVGGYEKPYKQTSAEATTFLAGWGSVMGLISAAAGGPEDAAEENGGETANNDKNHVRSPCGSCAKAGPASAYLKVAERASGSNGASRFQAKQWTCRGDRF